MLRVYGRILQKEAFIAAAVFLSGCFFILVIGCLFRFIFKRIAHKKAMRMRAAEEMQEEEQKGKESQLQMISEHDSESVENAPQAVSLIKLNDNLMKSHRLAKHQKNQSSLEKFDYKTAYSNYPTIMSPNTSGSTSAIDYDFTREIQNSSVSSSQRFQTTK